MYSVTWTHNCRIAKTDLVMKGLKSSWAQVDIVEEKWMNDINMSVWLQYLAPLRVIHPRWLKSLCEFRAFWIWITSNMVDFVWMQQIEQVYIFFQFIIQPVTVEGRPENGFTGEIDPIKVKIGQVWASMTTWLKSLIFKPLPYIIYTYTAFCCWYMKLLTHHQLNCRFLFAKEYFTAEMIGKWLVSYYET